MLVALLEKKNRRHDSVELLSSYEVRTYVGTTPTEALVKPPEKKTTGNTMGGCGVSGVTMQQ